MDEEDDNSEDEEEDVDCNLCEYSYSQKEIALRFVDQDDNNLDICKDCWKRIVSKAQSKGIMPTSETKIVEKIVEKPVEKIIYKTIDRNGNELGGSSRNLTKFDI